MQFAKLLTSGLSYFILIQIKKQIPFSINSFNKNQQKHTFSLIVLQLKVSTKYNNNKQKKK